MKTVAIPMEPRQVILPPPPEPVSRHSFPVAATVAPVIASIAIWMMTQSPFALLFALLGPIVALASLADSSWHGRRHRRRSLREYQQAMVEVCEEIDDLHRAERDELRQIHPDMADLFSREQVGVDWHRGFDGGLRIGRGQAQSDLRVSGAVDPRHTMTAVRESTAAALDRAHRLDDGPIVVDAFEGIGFVGPALVADAALRAGVIRLAVALDPTQWSVTARVAPPASEQARWNWVGTLPHESSVGAAERTVVEFARSPEARTDPRGAPTIAIWSVRHGHQLPRRCRTVVVLSPHDPPDPTDLHGPRDPHGPRRPPGLAGGPTTAVRVERPEFVGADEAHLLATAIRGAALAHGLITASPELPALVALSSLDNTPATAISEPGLSCAIGATATAVWSIDLVADGPHAVIGGTTGSGKSELLTSWILAIAARYGADEVTFLLVDFKGGATFGALVELPHSVGLITDLDHRGAARAIESLRAEMLTRERILAEHGIRSISEFVPGSAPLPRLVIVVDEFAALAADHPELHAVFSDLAARGRSLGVHLILCTQRPAASLRDAILANCTLRVCLRVNDAQDSIAVIGTPDAAALPRGAKGRALVSVAGEAPVVVQVAIASSRDAAAVVTTTSRPVRRPWCDPLPPTIALTGLAPVAEGIAFGIVDVPARQVQESATWVPALHGNLLALGGFSSGKSTLLDTLAESASAGDRFQVSPVPGDVEKAWDAVAHALAGAGADHPRSRVIAIDDVDALVTRLDRDHQLEFAERLTRLLRDGPHRGVFVAMAARTVPSVLGAAASACDTRVILRMTDRAEHVAAGGRSADHDERMPPGGGFWQGELLQVARGSPGPPPEPELPPVFRFPLGGTTAIVSSAPTSTAQRIAADGVRIVPVGGIGAAELAVAAEPTVAGAREHLVLIGDMDAWSGAWSILPGIRARFPLVFHGCSVADFRAITRSRGVPPALNGDDRVWLSRDDAVSRARLPRGARFHEPERWTG